MSDQPIRPPTRPRPVAHSQPHKTQSVFEMFVSALGVLVMLGSGLCTGVVSIGFLQQPGYWPLAGFAMVVGVPCMLFGWFLYWLGGGLKK